MNLGLQDTTGWKKKLCQQEVLSGALLRWEQSPFLSAHFSLQALRTLQNLWGHYMGGCQAARSLLQLKYIEFQFHSPYFQSGGKQIYQHNELKIFIMSDAAAHRFNIFWQTIRLSQWFGALDEFCW